MSGPTIALAVSGHGFGHSVRCAEVARALLARGARVVVRTDAPMWLYPEAVECVPRQDWPLDVGVAQHDGLELDIDATRRQWLTFMDHFEERSEVEGELLATHGVELVIGDIPPLAFEAAAHANIPSFGLSNFSWDWIYSAWPDFEDIVARIRGAYAKGDGLFRLPLHGVDKEAFAAFKEIEDVPLIVRYGRYSRAEIRAQLGLADAARVVLISFGGFSADGLNVEALGRWSNYVFVVTPPMTVHDAVPANVLVLNEAPADYVSLVAACDAVVTKPGYGIVADCLANRVAVLFTDRGPFREYDVLAAALPRLGRALYIPRRRLLAGELGPYLDALFESRAAWTDERMDGADVVAERALRNLTVKQQSP